MEMLGIDHVVFTVGDLSQAVQHYTRLGLRLQFHSEQAGAAVMVISEEHPNLLLLKGTTKPSGLEQPRLWIEVTDAQEALKELKEKGFELACEPRNATVGWLAETIDPWGNVMGFIDYTLQPQFGRVGDTKNRKEKVH